MIEVEQAEPAAAAELEVQPYQEIAPEPAPPVAISPDPVAVAAVPEADLAPMIADKVKEIRFYISQKMWDLAKEAILDLTELAPEAPEVTELIAEVSAGQAASKTVSDRKPAPAMEESPAAFAVTDIEEPPVSKPAHRVEKTPQSAPALDLENVLEISEPPRAKPASSDRPRAVAAAKEKSTEDILGDFILDLEQTDLADFAPKPTPAVAKAPAPVAAAAPAMEKHSVASKSVAPKNNGDMQDSESANVLSDILSELRDETSEAAEPEEDPETHYNLGIAFKEMGLLDEAIGELQKVCHAVDRGAPFTQPIQALTWLAQCLVDKGAPEAAVRWYQKALQLPGLDSGSRCSIYYDLGSAYQASGDNKSALTNFMEVYGSNIDFRDVASRIKALKA